MRSAAPRRSTRLGIDETIGVGQATLGWQVAPRPAALDAPPPRAVAPKANKAAAPAPKAKPKKRWFWQKKAEPVPYV